MKNKKKSVIIISALAVILLLVIVASDIFLKKNQVEKTDFAMGAVISQKITGRDAEETAEKIIEAIEKRENKISWRIEASEIALLNKNKTAVLSRETSDVLSEILSVCKKSEGAVDLTVGKLTEIWNIGSENFTVPDDKEISETLEDISWEKVSVENDTAFIGDNQKVDLGFVGKGIACDDAMKILRQSKATEGIINVGGSLCLYGDEEFAVGLRNPLGDVNDYMAVLTLTEGFASTSGNYERFSEYEGSRYHHILSTETGYPVESNLLSVTVFCQSGLLSDALSTACYCLGYEKSLTLLDEYNAEAVFIFDTKEVRVTDGLTDKVEIKNNEFELWKEN